VKAAQIQFMTVSEVASSLRVSTMTVYRLINSGELPRPGSDAHSVYAPLTSNTSSPITSPGPAEVG